MKMYGGFNARGEWCIKRVQGDMLGVFLGQRRKYVLTDKRNKLLQVDQLETWDNYLRKVGGNELFTGGGNQEDKLGEKKFSEFLITVLHF